MKCNEIKELLSLYIDGMLDEGERKEVEAHLLTCPDCRKEYEELAEMVALLGQAGTVPVPDAISFRLKKALKEEKQNMIDEGIISRPSKKKHQWRIITSVAAVFAVGILSFGLYHDVLGNLPGTGGGEQAGADQAIEAYDMTGKGLTEAEKGKDEAIDRNSTSDGSVVMKAQSSDPAPQAKTFGYAAAASADESAQADTYGSVAGSEPSADTGSAAGTGSAAADNAVESQTLNDTNGLAASNDANGLATSNDADGLPQDTRMFSKAAPAPEEECSRSLTSAGVERNAAAVQYYNKLIEEKLKDFDYQVLSSGYTQSGEWQFRIFIFRGKDGNTYNEEITIIGKDGEIKVICSDEFLGL